MSYRGLTRFRSRNSRGRNSYHSSGSRQSGARSRGQYISPERFVRKAVALDEEVVFTPERLFSDFGFIEPIQKNLLERGYTTPTAIQDGAIPHVMAGRDVVGLANTGTGKTAAFVLPLIHKLKNLQSSRTALIIAPTRELALQINQEFTIFAKNLGLYSTLVVGGMSIGRQINELRRNPHVVIGTPGRLKDLLQRNVLRLDRVFYFVLDEVDRMLDMGFIKDIRVLMAQLPKERQSLCLSATITSDITNLLKDMLQNPVTVSVTTGDTSKYVEQNVIEANSLEQKILLLTDLLKQPEFTKVLVFGETKHGVQRLSDTLNGQGVSSEAIHGNKSQPQRQRALQAFKSGRVSALIATDVAARGLDIPDVSHVINFDQPMTYSDYIHRIGRTGRAGKRGYALTFIKPR